MDRQLRVVMRIGIERDPAIFAQKITLQKAALHAGQSSNPLLDGKRRFDLGDLLPQQADALELQEAFNLERHAVGARRYLIELPLNVLQRDSGLDRVAVEDDQHFLPFAPCGHAGFARPADLQVASGPERVCRRRA